MQNNDLTVLVTGSTGYIGPNLIEMLLEKGYNVVGIDNDYFNEDCLLYDKQLDYKFIKKDIRDVTKEDLKGIDYVCHLAGLSNDPIGELNPNLTYEINHKASVKLAKLSKEVGVKKFIFSSSCSLYGISDTDIAINEDGKLAPVTAYAKSKVMTENDVKPLGDKDYSVTFLRNATAYGSSPKLRLDLVVNNLVGWALTQGVINILSDGTPWRPLVHNRDISQAFIKVIEAPSDIVNKEALNVGGNAENYQIRDLAEIIKKQLPSCTVKIGKESPDSRTYKVNFDKIRELLPTFELNWNVEKGVTELINDYKKYNMTKEKFEGKEFIRLKQLKFLIENKKIDEELRWSN